ncbi:hypothetical protein QUA78_32625, partial [Microcoleus sp. K4-B3]
LTSSSSFYSKAFRPGSAVTPDRASPLIPKSAVEAAIKFVKFSSDQIASLYAEFSERKALAPSLAKIVLLAEKKGGTLSTREAQLAFPFKHRPSAQRTKELFEELEAMNFGVVTTVKKTISFSLTTTTVTTVASNPYTESFVGDCSEHLTMTTMTTVNKTTVVNCGHTVVNGRLQSEALPDKALEPTVVTVVTNSAPSEKTEDPLLSSEPTRPLKSVAIPKDQKTFEVGDRVVVAYDGGSFYEGAKGKVIKVRGDDVTVDFDKRVRNMDFATFELTSTKLMKI